MMDKHFSLKFEPSNIRVTGGTIYQVPDHLSNLSFGEDTGSVNIILEEDLSLEDFEAKVAETIKKKSKLIYLGFQLQSKIGSLFKVVISLMIVIFLTLLAIHESLSYDLFSGSSSTNIFDFNSIFFYFLLSLTIVLFLVISPKIILGEYENLFEWANSRFSTHSRIIRRLERSMLAIEKLNQQNSVVNVWNFMVEEQDSWFCEQLLPALMRLTLPVNIMIRTDEKDAFLEVMRNFDMEISDSDFSKETETSIEKSFPYRLLSSWEKECIHCLLFSSTMQLPGSWKDDRTNQLIISKELSEHIFHFYTQSFSSSSSGSATFEKFVNRCVYDYGYIKPTSDKRTENFVLIDENLTAELDALLMQKVKDSVSNNLSRISVNLSDPLAFVILIGLIDSNKALSTQKINLISTFIKNVNRVENFQLMTNYWKYISANPTDEIDSFNMSPMQFMDVQTLTELSVCFVNSGMYDDAFEVYDILENVYPAKIAIEVADLKDSLGKYKEALEILLKTDEKWFKSGIVQDKGLTLKLCLNISWVIVSGRFENRKNEGFNYLKKTESILQKLPDTENYLLFLTQFYNTTANYYEWEKDYKRAIENYEKALKLPGTILRKSSLLSNRGISERLIAKESDDITVKKENLLSSCKSLRQAVKMKKDIGEKNQIPGSSHNLSETLIELAYITKDKAEKIEILKEADTVTTEALNILDELNSQKRRGRLLSEKYITHKMMGELNQPAQEKELKKLLDKWLQDEDKNSYDYREISRLLKQFEIAQN